MYWSNGSGLIELNITKAQAMQGAHQGQCDNDIAALRQVKAIARQLEKLSTEAVLNELREYGAWDSTEINDHDENLTRLLWCACCDIKEEYC